MRKLFKLALLLATMLVVAATAGCGGTDNFAGKWVGTTKATFDSATTIVTLNVEKKGDGYIVSSKSIRREGLWGRSEKGPKLQEQDFLNKENATAQNYKLNVKAMVGLAQEYPITFDENKKTLSMPGSEKFREVVLERDDDGKKLEQLKQELLAK